MAANFAFAPAGAKFLTNLIDQKMLESGRDGFQVMQQLVPVDTGLLKSTLGMEYDVPSHTLRYYVGNDKTPYAAAVEEGTIHQKAQPYVRPGLNVMAQHWGGNALSISISWPSTTFRLSGKRGPAHIARYNEKVARLVHRGKAAGRARVRYADHIWHTRSREHFLWEPAAERFESTPLL